ELPSTAIDGKHVFMELERNITTNFAVGTISTLGFSSVPDWDSLIGMEVTVLTKRNSGWFNINGVAPGDAPVGFKTIRPASPDGCFRLSRATFRFTSNGWTVISSTKLDDKYHQAHQKNFFLDYL